MTDERKNIKVGEETFESLKENKPDGWTWDYYLESLAFEHGKVIDPRESMPSVTIEHDVEPSDDAIDVARYMTRTRRTLKPNYSDDSA